jgi:hypothetical protein
MVWLLEDEESKSFSGCFGVLLALTLAEILLSMSPTKNLPPPTGDKKCNPSIWLALSGGDLRAAIFHYGCLKRMHEVGLLGHVASISATSGGSIIAALLQMRQKGIATDLSGEHRVPAHSSDNIKTAEAVCASSAFPPLFHAVPVSNRHGLIGVFADGGLRDNAALNVPKAFSVHIHKQRERYRESRFLPFREGTSHIWVVDGGKSGDASNRKGWGRLRAITRIVNILVDQQFDAVLLDSLNLDRNADINTGIMGLPLGFPQDTELSDEQLGKYAASVRTHLDAFSPEETAALAYCGYTWANYYISVKGLLPRYEWTQPAPLPTSKRSSPSAGARSRNPSTPCVVTCATPTVAYSSSAL